MSHPAGRWRPPAPPSTRTAHRGSRRYIRLARRPLPPHRRSSLPPDAPIQIEFATARFYAVMRAYSLMLQPARRTLAQRTQTPPTSAPASQPHIRQPGSALRAASRRPRLLQRLRSSSCPLPAFNVSLSSSLATILFKNRPVYPADPASVVLNSHEPDESLWLAWPLACEEIR